MQTINKTGFFGSSKARTAMNRWGISKGKSFLGLHAGKRSVYVEMFNKPNMFGASATPVLNIKELV
tara:strand:- start:54 stop:251 length:198 start_codon:yes stop_codon:yes gene_type:complete